MTNKAELGAILRAGHVVLRAFGARTAPLALVATLGLGVAACNAADKPGDAEKAKIEAVVREYILSHPEIIPEAMERLRANQMAKSVGDNRKDIETPYAGAWEGAADADVVLVEFFDYSCGYCRASVPDVTKLLAEDKKLKVVYRELPILGEESVLAARVGLLAADSNKYPAFHKAMYGAEQVDKASIQIAAEKAGLDKAKVQSILSSRGQSAEFAKNISLAQALDAKGTPLFIVGDQILHGAVGFEELKEAVAKARAVAKQSSSNKIS